MTVSFLSLDRPPHVHPRSLLHAPDHRPSSHPVHLSPFAFYCHPEARPNPLLYVHLLPFSLPSSSSLSPSSPDWALLSPDLEFLYIDPVFRSHLGPQADPIIRTRLLDFVHPDEYATAQQDLGKVLDNHILHGSVTR